MKTVCQGRGWDSEYVGQSCPSAVIENVVWRSGTPRSVINVPSGKLGCFVAENARIDFSPYRGLFEWALVFGFCWRAFYLI